jgi:hypothetical protein
MRKRKIQPGSFVDRAEARAVFNKDKRIDLRKYWAKNDDIELEPKVVENAQIQNQQVCRG